MQASFGFTVGNTDTNIRMKPDLGGGALLDAGSYPISLIRLVMGCAPERVMAHATWADTGVDISLMATLFYADGRRAHMSCAMDTANHRRATIVGSEMCIRDSLKTYGKAEDRSWFKPYQLSTVALQREDPLRLQMDHFIRVIQGLDAPLVSAHDGLQNLRVVEAIAQAAATQQSVLL